MPWTVTVRVGPRVERHRFDELEPALQTLEARGHELAGAPRPQVVDVKVRQFEPVEQVEARIELAGPQRMLATVRAGVDVRGDGSTEAYLGRIRREVVPQRKGETSFKALRRALQAAQPRS